MHVPFLGLCSNHDLPLQRGGNVLLLEVVTLSLQPLDIGLEFFNPRILAVDVTKTLLAQKQTPVGRPYLFGYVLVSASFAFHLLPSTTMLSYSFYEPQWITPIPLIVSPSQESYHACR